MLALLLRTIFAALGNELFQYFSKHKQFFGAPLSESDAAKIESVMHTLPTWGGLTVDRERLCDSFESWVFVTVSETEHSPIPVEGISYPVSAVLTWANSD